MRISKFYRVFLLAAVLSLSQMIPAFAAHKVLDSSSYVLSETAEGAHICTGKDGKAVTGWIADTNGNLYYYKKGAMDFGWDKIMGEWYYFDPDTGILAVNTKVLNYEVDEDGKMVKIHEW
ncbi:hypothetical protein B6K86_09470 [Lachnospiraceae bacterium]|jgi:hypothetical protein|nr:hypothetical protein B6K86_09470 [Lachnospiraceae bacterium]